MEEGISKEQYPITIIDEKGEAKARFIPADLKESFEKKFGEKPPTQTEFDAWTKEIKSPSSTPSEGYKFSPKLKKDLHDYLNSKPMMEVEGIITLMFETEQPDPYYTLEGIQMLTKYLQEKCPRVEAKPFLTRMANKELEKYAFTPANKPSQNGKEEKKA